MAYRWWDDDGPLIVVFGLSLPSSTKKNNKKTSKLDPHLQNVLDPHMVLLLQFYVLDPHMVLLLQTILCSWSAHGFNITNTFLFFQFTIKASDATVGQGILNLKYHNEHAQNSTNQWIGRRQKILYALLLIGCPWLKKRSHDIISLLGLRHWKNQVSNFVTNSWT